MSKIELKHIDKFYGKNHILKDVNLTIEDGDFMTLLGPSGCGKTTTLRVVSGLEKPQNGTIHMDGKEIVNAAEAHFAPPSERDLNLVFQSYALWPHMTVRENIAFGLNIQKLPKDEVDRRIKDALGRMQIGQYVDRYPSELSGGQQQRVALARAIVIEPEVLLMDEPLSNLDAKLRVEMRNAIKRIQQQFGITTVYVTHDQEEALAVSDRIAVMDGGVIQQIDTPQRVYQRPANRFVSNFIGLSNFLNATVSRGGDGAELCFAGSDYRAAMTNLCGEASDGMDVLAAVRPEEFLLSTGEGKGIPATVRSSVFLGTTTHYFLTLPTGQEIEAVRDSDEEWAVIPDGAEVHLRVKPRRINVFTADGKRSLVIREELL